jgi:hypothetical protein
MDVKYMESRFITLCKENIHRDGIDDLLNYIQKSDFLIAPASTKYHGCTAGGLAEHSLNVYHCLMRLCEQHREVNVSTETITLTALFHDICKTNFYKKAFRNVKNDETGQWESKEIYEIEDKLPLGHGEKSVILLQAFVKLNRDEIYAIRWHMGGFDNAVKGGDYGISRAYEMCPFAVLLGMADMEATYLLENKNEKG